MGAFEVIPSDPVRALFGDYNRNGTVDAADYIVWRKALNQSVAPFSGADGDGDGLNDQDDYHVWRAHFGQSLPPLPAAGMGSTVASVTLVAPVDESAGETASMNLSVRQPNGTAHQDGGSGEIQAVSQHVNLTLGLAPRSMHFDRYQPEQRGPLSPQQSIAADRSDVALMAWLTSQPDSKAHFEDSGAAKTSGSEDAGGGVDIKIDSVEQVFAMFADS